MKIQTLPYHCIPSRLYFVLSLTVLGRGLRSDPNVDGAMATSKAARFETPIFEELENEYSSRRLTAPPSCFSRSAYPTRGHTCFLATWCFILSAERCTADGVYSLQGVWLE